MSQDELSEMLVFINKLETGEVKFEGGVALTGLDTMLSTWQGALHRIIADASTVEEAVVTARAGLPR